MNSDAEPRHELKEVISTAVIGATEPLGRTGLTACELSAGIGDGVVPEDVREILEAAEWAHPRDDEGHAWNFDRHVVFAESIDDVITSHSDRYEESDFR